MTYLEDERRKQLEEDTKIEIPPMGKIVGFLDGVPPPDGWPTLVKRETKETEPSLKRRERMLYWGVIWWSEQAGAKILAVVCFACGSHFDGGYEEITVREKRKELWPRLDAGILRLDGKLYRCRCAFGRLRRGSKPEASDAAVKEVLRDRLAEAKAGQEFMKQCGGKPSSLLEDKRARQSDAEQLLRRMVGIPRNATAVAWLETHGDTSKNRAFREAMRKTERAVQVGDDLQALDDFSELLTELVREHRKTGVS